MPVTLANSARHMPPDPLNPLHCRIDFLLLRVLPFGFISTPLPHLGVRLGPFFISFQITTTRHLCHWLFKPPLCFPMAGHREFAASNVIGILSAGQLVEDIIWTFWLQGDFQCVPHDDTVILCSMCERSDIPGFWQTQISALGSSSSRCVIRAEPSYRPMCGSCSERSDIGTLAN